VEKRNGRALGRRYGRGLEGEDEVSERTRAAVAAVAGGEKQGRRGVWPSGQTTRAAVAGRGGGDWGGEETTGTGWFWPWGMERYFCPGQQRGATWTNRWRGDAWMPCEAPVGGHLL
jgi:hypothetical protein